MRIQRAQFQSWLSGYEIERCAIEGANNPFARSLSKFVLKAGHTLVDISPSLTSQCLPLKTPLARSELAFESPKLWKLQTRLQHLFIATLAFAFAFLLLRLLTDHELTQKLIRLFCHRTGKKLKQTKAPLYRLSSALSRLWLPYPPIFALLPQLSG